METDTHSKNVFLFQGVGGDLDRLLSGLEGEQLEILNELCKEASDYVSLDLNKFMNDRNSISGEFEKGLACTAIASLTDVALFRSFLSRGITPDYLIGYSIGLDNAIYCSDSMSLKDSLNVLKNGNRSLAESQSKCGIIYDMGVVIGLEPEQISELIEKNSSSGELKIASINSDFMTVLSGNRDELGSVLEKALEEGALKAFMLGVGGPLHTSMMKQYSSCYFNAVKNVDFSDAKYPIVSAFSQKVLTSADDIRNELMNNFVEPMQWQKSIEYLESIGVRNFYDLSSTSANKKASVLKNEDSRFITIKSLKNRRTLK